MTGRVLRGVVRGLSVGLLLVAGPARAALVTFYGADNSVGPAGAKPNATAARDAREDAVGSFGEITFEGLMGGPSRLARWPPG